MTVWRCPHCKKVIYRKETTGGAVTLERMNRAASSTDILDWNVSGNPDQDLGLPPPIDKEVPDAGDGK